MNKQRETTLSKCFIIQTKYNVYYSSEYIEEVKSGQGSICYLIQ